MEVTDKRSIFWVGSSLKDLTKMPQEVQNTFNFGLIQAAKGLKHVNAKPLKGFGANSVLEIVEDHRSGTYRAVYTIRFKKAVYVLHVFQKKSKRKIATPKEDMDLIEERLKRASREYKEVFGGD
jgi:phage-related protein